MRVAIIGATGHVGTYLVPMLDALGHEVIAVSRGERTPYRAHSAFDRAKRITIDRSGDETDFTKKISELNADVVIDMICFRLESCVALVEALRGNVKHLLVCGTIWIHGTSAVVPTREEEGRTPYGDYGVQKLEITEYLEGEARLGNIPATIVHPGHIVGPGWPPINPEGHFNVDVWRKIASGDGIRLPNFGMETVHHVHAEDVAAIFLAAINNFSSSIGESFHIVSPTAISLRGYAEAMYRWFGTEPSIEYLPWEQWAEGVDENDARMTYDHISHSPNCSMEKAKRLLGFIPRYDSLAAVKESVSWLLSST